MIIVTGASDGLGKRIIEAANAEGIATVNISRHENSQATTNILADLGDESSIDEAVKRIMLVKNPTALVLNAGVLSLEKFKDVTGSEFDRVFSVNVKASLLLLTKLRDWIEEHEVDVVIINSISGIRPFKNQLIYDASKWALKGITEDLRLELEGTASRVIGVYPGMLDTNIADKLPSGPMPPATSKRIDAKNLAELILNCLGQPKHIQVSDVIIDRKNVYGN